MYLYVSSLQRTRYKSGKKYLENKCREDGIDAIFSSPCLLTSNTRGFFVLFRFSVRKRFIKKSSQVDLLTQETNKLDFFKKLKETFVCTLEVSLVIYLHN